MEDRIGEPHMNRMVGKTNRPNVIVTHPRTLIK